MNFSELYPTSGHLAHFSPDGSLLARAHGVRVFVHNAHSLHLLHCFSCCDTVSDLVWSPDGELIATALHARGIVQVWKIDDPSWTCKIDEGDWGLTSSHWSPDSRHILNTSLFHSRISIWSLINKQMMYIDSPKECPGCGFAFTSCGQYLAVPEKRGGVESVIILSTSSWQLVTRFETETSDLGGLCWSHDDLIVCIWDGPVHFKVLFYLPFGELLGKFEPSECSIGISCVRWAPTSALVAIGSHDNKVRLVNGLTFHMAVCWHTALEELDSEDLEDAIIYEEVPINSDSEESSLFPDTRYRVASWTIPDKEGCESPVMPKMGDIQLTFSPSSHHIAGHSKGSPMHLFIWDLKKTFSLKAVLIQMNPIKHFAWDAQEEFLAVCTGNDKVYMWSPEGCLAVRVPQANTELDISRLKWQPRSGTEPSAHTSLCVVGSSHISVCIMDSVGVLESAASASSEDSSCSR